MDLIKINDNTEEIKKVIGIANNHIKNRPQSYIHFSCKTHNMTIKLNREAELVLVYSLYDSSKINCIDFIRLNTMYLSSIDIDNLRFISMDYNDYNILESISFYLKDVGTMSIEFNDK